MEFLIEYNVNNRCYEKGWCKKWINKKIGFLRKHLALLLIL